MFDLVTQEFEEMRVVRSRFLDMRLDLLEFGQVLGLSQEGWGQILEECLAVVTMVLLFDAVNHLEELVGIDLTLLLVFAVVEMGLTLDIVTLTLESRFVDVHLPEIRLVLIVWNTSQTPDFLQLVNI